VSCARTPTPHPDTTSFWTELFQEPLYLPSNSELDVHIWRLTDSRSRKVWYEWHAEAFLPLPSSALHNLSSPSLGVVNGFGQLGPATPGPRSPQMGAIASPMMDAAQLSGGSFRDGAESLMGGRDGLEGGSSQAGRLKIGQSSLMNPQGRSSFIGL
jgi:protein arginine N-methyltransferase 5